MSAKPDHVRIMLGAASHQAPRLNIGQIRRLMALYRDFAAKGTPDTVDLFDHGVAVASLVFERASPPIDDFDQLETTPAELRIACDAVLEFSGLKAKDAAEGKTPAAA
jgi:hypothetical protein